MPVKRSNLRMLIPVVAALAAIGVALIITSSLGGPSGEFREELATEFVGSYPTSPLSTGEPVEWAIVAAPTTVQLSEGISTDVWAYNATVPGPEIRLLLGDTARIRLDNQLPQATTIHWHGVRVPNDMDGVPGVNQTAVEPGESFVYEFTPPDAGTFWFHSHTRGSEQLERGLYGSLIVEDPNEPIYDRDVVWVIDDWLLDDSGELDTRFNGAHETSHNGRWGNVVTVNGEVGPTIVGRPGERIRLRLINASNARAYNPQFGELETAVIAVDGLLSRAPASAAGIVLAPGNRIDIDVTLPPTSGVVDVVEDFNGEGFLLGQIVTDGEPVDTPKFAAPSNPDVPAWANAVEAGVDHEYSLDFLMGMMNPRWGFNGKSFDDTETYAIPSGEFRKIRLNNSSQALHPIHIHGQFFKTISVNGEPVDEGHFRDTVLVMPGEQIDVGLVATDKGTWIIHCHIQEHAEAGMITLLEVQ